MNGLGSPDPLREEKDQLEQLYQGLIMSHQLETMMMRSVFYLQVLDLIIVKHGMQVGKSR